jgi:hypothetical protein
MSAYKNLLEAAIEASNTISELDKDPFMDASPALAHLGAAIRMIREARFKRQNKAVPPHKDQMPLSTSQA